MKYKLMGRTKLLKEKIIPLFKIHFSMPNLNINIKNNSIDIAKISVQVKYGFLIPQLLLGSAIDDLFNS